MADSRQERGKGQLANTQTTPAGADSPDDGTKNINVEGHEQKEKMVNTENVRSSSTPTNIGKEKCRRRLYDKLWDTEGKR
ncbi:unnamed protein product [Urochloa humidicola]